MLKFRVIICLIVLLAPTGSRAADAGDAGALFLRIGMGARASGMGEAFGAVAKDASSVYWNPGAMSAVLGTQFMFMHNEYLQSIRLEQAALTHETDFGTLGLGFAGLYMDEMDRFESVPSAIPLGTFSAYDVSFSVGFSRYVVPNLSAGVVGKFVFENIDDSTAKGFAVDAGLFHVSRIRGVKFAAVVSNLGAPINFEDDRFVGEDFSLPRVAKLAGAFERHYNALRGDVLITLDVLFPNDSGVKQHIGAEYGYDKKLYLRGGFKGGYNSQGPTAGVGIHYDEFEFNYAVLFVRNDLGDSHRFSMSLRI